MIHTWHIIKIGTLDGLSEGYIIIEQRIIRLSLSFIFFPPAIEEFVNLYAKKPYYNPIIIIPSLISGIFK